MPGSTGLSDLECPDPLVCLTLNAIVSKFAQEPLMRHSVECTTEVEDADICLGLGVP